MDLLNALLNGLILGLIYVAIAIGLTIIFGMLRLVNFAHGAFYAIGAYVGLIAARQFGLVAGLIAAPIVVAALAVVLDRVLLRFFYDKDTTAQILVTFGIAVIVEESLRLIFGGTTQQLSFAPGAGRFADLRRLRIPGVPARARARDHRHRRGRVALHPAHELRPDRARGRARPDDGATARRQRHAWPRPSSSAWARRSRGSSARPQARSTASTRNTGFTFLVPSFVVVVVGGLGSFWGAVIGGILIGELQSLTSVVLPVASDVIIYVAMAVVLLVRPQGLLGESEVIRG